MAAPSYFLRVSLLFALQACTATDGIAAATTSDVGRPLSRQFLPEDYRGFEQVWDFAQTDDGLIYATNYGALREFDGREWRTIPLPTSWVFKATAAPDGRLFIAGFDEIGYVERTPDGQREYHSLVALIPEAARPPGQATACVWHRGAVYWSANHNVLRWDGATMRVWNLPGPSQVRVHDGGEHLYAEGAGPLHRFDPAADDWAVVADNPALTRRVAAIFDRWDRHGAVIVRRDGTIDAFDETGRLTSVPTGLEGAGLNLRVMDADRLSDGRLALATTTHGLLLLAPEGRLDQRFGTFGGVPSPDLHGIFEDREHGLWLGSNLGIARFDPARAVTLFDRDNGAPAGVCYALFRFRGELHSGGNDGLYRFEPGDPFRPARFARVPSAAFAANQFVEHRSGLLIAADAGLLRYDGAQVITEFEHSPAMHFAALSRSDPDLLFTCDSHVVSTARWNGTAWEKRAPLPAAGMDARSLVESDDGSLWIGTPTRGAARLRRNAGDADWSEAAITIYDQNRGLPVGHEWTTVRATPHGMMFVHAKGVSVYDATQDRVIPAPAFDAVGKNGRYIYAFACGGDGTMWVQIGDPTRGDTPEIGGVAPVPGGGWKWISLPPRVLEALGYLGAQEINWELGDGGRGALWIAGQKNLVRVDLAAALATEPARAVAALLRDVTLGARRLTLASDTPVRLGFSREALRLHFASPTFGPCGAVEFQFRLAGFNDAWSPWSTRDEATYTNLPRGPYEFQVRARAGGGEPGPVAAWNFALRPPWWQSTPAYLAYAAGLLLALLASVRWRLAQAERERARLEQVVSERTDQLAQARDRAEDANAAKTMFLARMSHELRTPLHAILGYAQMLAVDTAIPAGARDRLRVVRASGQHLLRLINEVLDLSKIEAGKQEVRREPFDLPALLQDVCDAQEARATLKGLEFRRPMEPLPQHVLGDASKLRQVLDNLLGNATKFTTQGEVELNVRAVADGKLSFAVRDTGPGIARDEQARLFQPFSQARSGARPTEGGTGLGLAIAQRLVTLMGGELTLASEPGAGATFSFTLPLPAAARPLHPTREARRIAGYDGPRRRVLAVDDVEANRTLFTDLLAPLGFEVVTANSAEEVLGVIDRVRPDLLLLDLRLPGMDGFELARRVRRDPRLEGMKILAASASVLGHDPRAAIAAGCDGFIPKPFLADDFLGRVGEVLGLTWREHGAEETPADTSPLPPAALLELRTAARAGDVVTMRAVLARLRASHARSPHVAELAGCLQSYDLPRLIQVATQLLDTAAAPDPR